MRKNKHSWYNDRCEGAKKIRDAARKRWRKQRMEINREKYRETRNDHVRIKMEEGVQFEKDNDELKLFYRHIRGKMMNREVIEELEKDGITYKTAQEMSEIMNYIFKAVFCVEEEFTEPRGEVGVSGSKELQVERKEIRRILEKLDIRKAMRPDGISNWTLKECRDEVVEISGLLLMPHLWKGQCQRSGKEPI